MTAPAAAVRRAGPADLETLTRLWIGITRHHTPLDPLFTLRAGAETEVRELLRRTLRDPEAAIFVCEVGARVVGMSSVRIDRAPAILEEVVRGEITDLGVTPEHRRRGVGRALAAAALDWARDRGSERVEVRVVHANQEGQGFWRELGFAPLLEILQRRLA